jgi:hypothetical protein
MLYFLHDFQEALSASAFLSECDPDRPIHRVDLRRFKCYETTLVVAYTRPFSQARGDIPKLTLELCGPPLRAELLQLHQSLLDLRNRAVAHSDGDRMRLVSKSWKHDFQDGNAITMFHSAYDEGLSLIGDKLWLVDELIRTLFHGIYKQLWTEAQRYPEVYNFRKDYL